MRLTILQGDVYEQIEHVPDASIDLCITSPPYWGLRTYNAGPKELGSEPSMETYLENTLRWVQEVWRILKPTGSFVLNMGDCWYGSWGGGYDRELKMKGNAENQPYGALGLKHPDRTARYYKEKQLLSVSSFLYCKIVSETDFVCRGEHIWCKPNVPTPIRSRLKQSHEKVFWFVKDAKRYYFDQRPWEKTLTPSNNMRERNLDSFTYPLLGSKQAAKRNVKERDSPHLGQLNRPGPTSCFRGGHGEDYLKPKYSEPPRPRKSYHWKDELRAKGNKDKSAESGKTIEHSWRVVPVGSMQSGFEITGRKKSEHVAPYPEELVRPYLKGMAPNNGTIFDPFLGSGTTMRVAMEEGRDCIGIELNAKSVAYAKKRCNFGTGLADYAEAMP